MSMSSMRSWKSCQSIPPLASCFLVPTTSRVHRQASGKLTATAWRRSDKATVEITSPFTGTVSALSGDVGTVMKVGGVLCEVEVESEFDEDAGAGDSLPPGVSCRFHGGRNLLSARSLPRRVQTPSQSEAAADAVYEAIRASAPASKPTSAPAPAAAVASSSAARGDSESVLASPATRRLAREHNIDLADIASGSGKGGRVVPEDILAYASRSSSAPISTSSTLNVQPGQPIPLSPLRRAMYKSMTQSLRIPHFAYSDTLDVTSLSRLRATLNGGIPLRYRATLTPAEERALKRQEQWGAPGRVPEGGRFDRMTLMPLLLKALSCAMAENPLFLCTLEQGAEGGESRLVPRKGHDISVALASPSAHNGLFTPLIPQVDTLSPFDIAARLTELQAAANATADSGGVPAFPKHAQGRGTMTLSNVGAIGGRGTHPVIPPGGQLVIGAMGRVRCEPGYADQDQERAMRTALGEEGGTEDADAKGGALALRMEPRLRMDVSFSADHRVVEGVELARLVETWKRLVERPERLVGLGR